MTLRQLQMLQAVRRRASLSAAAEELSVTQPAVSMQMKELQAEIGAPLFRSEGKRLVFTEAGEELSAYAERVLNLVAEAREAVRARAREGGLVRVAASSTPGVSLLPPLIAAYRRRDPRATVRLQVTNTESVEDRLKTGEADVGVVGGRLTSADLALEPWREDELVLVVSPAHRLARRRTVRAAALAGEVLLAREHGSATRTTYEAAFLKAGVPLPEPQVVGDSEAIKRAVAAGMGVAILSRFSVGEEVRAKSLRALRIEGVELSRPLKLLYPTGPPRSASVARFLEFLRAAGQARASRRFAPKPID